MTKRTRNTKITNKTLLTIALLFTLFSNLYAQSQNSKEQTKDSHFNKTTPPYPDRLLENEARIDELIKKMNLEEKVSMIHANSSFTSGGVPRLGIPELVMSDGPHGVRKEHGRDWTPDNLPSDSVTYLPTVITLASTWNRALGYEYGKVLGREAKFRGKDMILGPGINIIRTPLNGRNFEYFSEDPYLISQLAPAYIKGVQEQGVSACAKHFLANNQEVNRSTINVLMSERALREIYLPGFRAAVKDGNVYSIMGAYNKFRGQYCTHNEYLVNKFLKGELGFNGLVVSDWAAVHNTLQAVNFGTDIEMGTELGPDLSQVAGERAYDKFFMGEKVLALVQNGVLSETIIDDKVRRILRVMFQTKLSTPQSKGEYNTSQNQKVAYEVAKEGIVLLKNEKILPLSKKELKSIAVIGANAVRKHAGGGGSSQVTAKYEITPLEGLKLISERTTTISFAEGYRVEKNFKADQNLIREAAELAKKSEVAIVFGGFIHGYTDAWNDNAFDAEAVDKKDIFLPFGQNELIEAVIKANPNTIVVLTGGGAVDMRSWRSGAKAIIQAGYPGMEGGKALAEIIYGDANPSGKLTFSFPEKLEDSPAHQLGEYPGDGNTVQYKDDIFVGYRFFDTYKVKPAYPFGHGLSYTSFTLRDLKVDKTEDKVVVTLRVKNSGKIKGAEVVQLYVKDEECSVKRPEKELKGFEKVFLNAGEEKVVAIILNQDAFKFYDEGKSQWVSEPGTFSIFVGNSSENILLKEKITL